MADDFFGRFSAIVGERYGGEADTAGVVQVTQEPPPKGRRYEKVDIQPRDGIEVDGGRR